MEHISQDWLLFEWYTYFFWNFVVEDQGQNDIEHNELDDKLTEDKDAVTAPRSVKENPQRNI